MKCWSAGVGEGFWTCAPESLSRGFWILVVFDLARLDAEGYAVVAASVKGEFRQHLFWLPAGRIFLLATVVRNVARKIAAGAGVSLIDVVRLYLSTRGLKACIERFFRLGVNYHGQ